MATKTAVLIKPHAEGLRSASLRWGYYVLQLHQGLYTHQNAGSCASSIRRPAFPRTTFVRQKRMKGLLPQQESLQLRSFGEVAVPDKVCSLFTDHDAGSIRVSADYLGHHRGIHHPQAFYSVHSQLCVHYGHAILFGSHSCRPHRMIDSLFFMWNQYNKIGASASFRHRLAVGSILPVMFSVSNQ